MHDSRPRASEAGRIHRIAQGDADYPGVLLTHLGDRAPREMTALGNLGILRRGSSNRPPSRGDPPPTLAFFCSARCPLRLIKQAYKLALHVRAARLTVIGGFHSPGERHFLSVLLRGVQPTIMCPARSVADLRLTPEHERHLAQGRLLVLSPFADTEQRITAESARYRNRFAAALADRTFVTYARPGGKTERLGEEILAWGKPLYTFEGETNARLVALGATAIAPEAISTWA